MTNVEILSKINQYLDALENESSCQFYFTAFDYENARTTLNHCEELKPEQRTYAGAILAQLMDDLWRSGDHGNHQDRIAFELLEGYVKRFTDELEYTPDIINENKRDITFKRLAAFRAKEPNYHSILAHFFLGKGDPELYLAYVMYLLETEADVI